MQHFDLSDCGMSCNLIKRIKENDLFRFACDMAANTIHLLVKIVFKPHVKFIQSEFWIHEPTETVKTR